MAARALLLGAALAAGPAPVAASEVLLTPVLSNLDIPTLVTSARDGSHRLFILEQGGLIKVLPRGAAEPTVFLDLRATVMTGSHQGLVGLAFHPQYASNGRFFVDYTRAEDAVTVVAEYRVSDGDPDVADPTERVLLEIPYPLPNVTAGTLAFGPDGFLYIGVGNAGVTDDPQNTAQDLHQLAGKILRIDVDRPSGDRPYAAPPGNPFVGAGRDEVFAYGLRNPWRFSFDRLTGELLAGDVGNLEREEVNVITRGGNYGWRVWEGTVCAAGEPGVCDAPAFLPPLVEYAHEDGRCAVVGGHAYRGRLGTLTAGSYVFGDFCSGEVFVLEAGVVRRLLATSLVISSFGEDEEGEIYVVDWLGAVYRLTAPAPSAAALTLALTRNAPRVAPGEWLRLGLSVSNLSGAGPQDLYFGILVPPLLSAEFGCPDGDALVFLAAEYTHVPLVCVFTASPASYAPLFRGIVFPPTFPGVTTLDLFDLLWPPGLADGPYTFLVFTTTPGALADASIEPADITGFAAVVVDAVP